MPAKERTRRDLIILIEEEAHKDLHREGLNVIYDLHISFPDAVFGTQVESATMTEEQKLRSPQVRKAAKYSG
jgi:molecular chaperone DnaJ